MNTIRIATVILAAAGPAAVAADSPNRPTAAILRSQAEECRRLLKSSTVDFFLPASLDRANGGFLETFREGKFVPTGEKFVTLQARQTWFFSTLAEAGIERDAALAAARSGFDFLEKHFRDRVHGGYFAIVTAAGRPVDRRKHVYFNSFVLYALAAYHRATRDAAALTAARDLFGVLEAKAHDGAHGGYHEFFQEDWTPVTDRRVASFIGPGGTKTYNTHLHALEAVAELYRVWPDPFVRRRLDELFLVNTSSVRLPAHGCNVDGFLPDWTPIDSPKNLRASCGHDVEGAWLCLDAARTLGHPPATLRGWAEGLVGYSVRHGYDRQHGGFFYTGPVGQPADDTKKEWWVQAEALVSMLEMYRLTGKAEYYDLFAGTFEFVKKHQVAAEGGWWAARAADGAPLNPSRASMWQGGYHAGRALLFSARLLDDLAGADDAPRNAPLRVRGSHLVNPVGERVRLRGVNVASLEWTSDGGGRVLDTVRVAVEDWKSNVIRLPLTQDRWFGKGPEQKDGGTGYRELVRQVVDYCGWKGCYVVLDLHWADAGVWGRHIGQRNMPDKNSVAFWTDAAAAYKDHPAVLFDLFNEPHDVTWEVWRNGGPVTERDRRSGTELNYEAVGMQPLLDAVRATGAKNVVIVGGLNWAYDMSGFLDGKGLGDPSGNGVVYANHAYPAKRHTAEQWSAKMAAAAKQVSVIVSEFGAEPGGASSDGVRGDEWIRPMLRALRDLDVDWIAWDMHPQAGPRLVSDWRYTPTPTFGVHVKAALSGRWPDE